MNPSSRFNKFKSFRLVIESLLVLFLCACAQSPNAPKPLGLSIGKLDPLGPAAEWRALNRLSYGPTPFLVRDIQSNGHPQAWALAQLQAAREASQKPPNLPPDLASINDSLPTIFDGARREREARAAVPAGTQINEGIANEKRFNFQEPPEALYFNRTQVNKAIAWRIASCSNDEVEQPLLARMTEFWFNHFNVYQQKGPVRPFAGHYAINVARKHALGKFEDLVLASARHPAMLYYLDQWLSVSPLTARPGQNNRGLNENYARELMELHTLGVQGGYSQNDVRELARVLTGWTIDPKSSNGFQFVPRLHEAGLKSVMGQTFPKSPMSAGEAEGIQAIRYLANHPATALRISRRLAEYFVADNPSDVLVEGMAKTFIATGGDIAEVMKTLLTSADFWSPDNTLYKTPFEYACTSLRVMNAGLDRTKWLQAVGYTAAAGQGIQNWLTPDGYAFSANTWLTPEALTRRIDFALTTSRNVADRTDLYAYLSDPTQQAVKKQATSQRLGFVLGSSELVFK